MHTYLIRNVQSNVKIKRYNCCYAQIFSMRLVFLKTVYKKRLLWVLIGILLRDFFNQNKVKLTKKTKSLFQCNCNIVFLIDAPLRRYCRKALG